MTTPLLRGLVLTVAMIAAVGLGFERTVEAAPSISLSPDSGDAPSVTGSISGSSWLCDSGAPSGETVSGPGVSGWVAFALDREGNLSGEFTIDGDPGDSVEVTVTAYCPGIVPILLSASAAFTFNAAEPTDTPTPRPTRTPVPTSTIAAPPTAASTATPSPPRATPSPAPATPGAAPTGTQGSETPAATSTSEPGPVASSGAQMVTFAGCTPDSPVELEFVPLYILGVDAPSDAPTGPGMMVPAVQTGDAPGMFAFDPPASDPGRLFRVTAKTGDTDCALEEPGLTDYWIDGQSLVVPMTMPGATQLHVCEIGDKVPCEHPLVKGAFIRRGQPAVTGGSETATAPDAWVTEKPYYADDLKKGKFRFRSTVDAAGAGAARLQASVLPYPKTAEQDPMSPQGLVASWDIACVNCEFTVDLSPLAPEEPPKKKAWYKKVADVTTMPFKAAAKGGWKAITWVGDLAGIGGAGDSPDTTNASKIEPQTTLPGEYVVNATAKLPVPTTFYFRLLPVDQEASAKIAGPASNAVRLLEVDKPPDIKVISTPTPVQTESPYEVEIIAYHGIIPPVVPNKICYIATKDAWPADLYGWMYTTDPSKAYSSPIAKPVKAGQPICKPDPKEPSILEAILSWAEDAVNWASEAWSDLKAFAVDTILKYTPLGLQCSLAEDAGALPDGACEAAFTIALDATLVALGIPPNIPNFDQLVDQGIEYLAAEIAAQVAIPPGVVQAAIEEGGPYAGLALSVAEAKLREELQQEIEDNLADAALSIQLGHAASVAWVPDGIPVRPDDYQPPGMTLRVTRKKGVAGGDAGCSIRVQDSLKLSKGVVQSPPAEWSSLIKGLKTPLNYLTTYDLFVDESALGVDKDLFVPPLAPGDSYTIPMTFKPNYYKSGWSPNGLITVTQYINVWRYLHDFGTIHVDAFGSCGSDELDAPAKATILGAQVTP